MKRFFRLKTLFIVGFTLAALATLLAIIVVVINIRGRRAWEAYAAEARQRGVKLSLQELLPPPVPDAENFAAVPLFANLFSANQAGREAAVKAFALPTNDGKPLMGSLSEARLTDLGAWQQAFVTSKDLTAAGADPASDILAGLEHRLGPELAQLAEAERRPRACFPVPWELGFGALLPHLSVCRVAAQIHQLRMVAHLARGDSAAAYAEFRGALRVVQALEGEPTLISHLVRLACLHTALSGVWEGLMSGGWADADLAGIIADVAPINLLADYEFTMGGERGIMNDMSAQLLSSREKVAELVQALGGHGTATSAFVAATPVSGLIHFNQLALNHYHDGRLERIDAPTLRLFVNQETPFEPEHFQQRASFVKRAFYRLYLLAAPALSNVERTTVHDQTMLHFTRLAGALELARRADGAYPDTLTALVPQYLPALPNDIIDGQPLRYRRTDDKRFLLYSIAMNARDDGGTLGKAESARDGDDWPWRWSEPPPHQ